MKRLGIVRLEAVKRMSVALKKALGIQYGHALERLSRACGMASYHELRTLAVERRQRADQFASGTDEELLIAWRAQLSEAFDASVDVVLGSDVVDVWFRRVFVPRARLVEESSVGEASAAGRVVDQELEASNWRDAEFRAWVEGLTVRPTQPVLVEVKRRRKWDARADELTEVEG